MTCWFRNYLCQVFFTFTSHELLVINKLYLKREKDVNTFSLNSKEIIFECYWLSNNWNLLGIENFVRKHVIFSQVLKFYST